MKILIVGAGAIGQVYALHAHRGGAQVAFWTRPAYHKDIDVPLLFFSAQEEAPIATLSGHRVLSDLNDLEDEWDELWICISSTALKKGDWLNNVLQRIPTARILSLTPGFVDKQWLTARFPHRCFAFGLITCVAWQHPLSIEKNDEAATIGIGYWFPPLVSSPFEGLSKQAHAILQRGGMKTVERRNLSFQSAMGSAALLTAVANLESHGWSISALSRYSSVQELCAGIREAQVVVATYHNESIGLYRFLGWTWVWWLLLRVAPLCTPFPLERFLTYHFVKVADQTKETLLAWIENATTPTVVLSRLYEELSPQDQP